MRGVDANAPWLGRDARGAHYLTDDDRVSKLIARVRAGEYVDTHFTVYTPESFLDLFHEATGLFDLLFLPSRRASAHRPR